MKEFVVGINFYLCFDSFFERTICHRLARFGAQISQNTFCILNIDGEIRDLAQYGVVYSSKGSYLWV